MNLPLLTMLSLILLIGCSNVASIGQTPIKSAPVASIAERVRTQTVTIRESNTSIQQGLDAAIDQLGRISREKVASDEQLQEVWDKLTGVQERVAAQWDQIQSLEKTNSEMSVAATASDIEKEELRKITKADAEWKAKHGWKVTIYNWFMLRVYWILGIVTLGGIGFFIFKAATRRIP